MWWVIGSLAVIVVVINFKISGIWECLEHQKNRMKGLQDQIDEFVSLVDGLGEDTTKALMKTITRLEENGMVLLGEASVDVIMERIEAIEAERQQEADHRAEQNEREQS